MTIFRKLRRFRTLDPVERRLTMQALLLPMGIYAGFSLFGVPRTQAWVRRWTRIRGSAAADHPETCAAMACRAQRRVARATGISGPCLVRSMALWGMLLRCGVEVYLRVGFRKRDAGIEGHAWVEHNGVPLNEDPAEASTFDVYHEPAAFDMWLKPKSEHAPGR